MTEEKAMDDRLDEAERRIALVESTLLERKRCRDKIRQIADYLEDESFPPEHLDALLAIASYFNWSDESEADVFNYARYLIDKYGVEIRRMCSGDQK